jgi:hypothetical protein
MNITNTMCRLSKLSQEQINSIKSIAPDDGFLDFYVEEINIGFSEKGNFGTWESHNDLTIVTYTEMMQLLGKTMEFTKLDLKTGMFVKYRGGSYRIVIGDCLSGNGCAALSQYSEDLKYAGCAYAALDIMAVYKAAKGTNLGEYLSGHCLTLIWERTEQTQAQKEMEELLLNIEKGEKAMSVMKEQAKVLQSKL